MTCDFSQYLNTLYLFIFSQKRSAQTEFPTMWEAQTMPVFQDAVALLFFRRYKVINVPVDVNFCINDM